MWFNFVLVKGGRGVGWGEGGGADAVDQGDGGAGVGDGEAVACQGVFVDFGMQVAKAFGEFDLLAVHGDGAVGHFSFFQGFRGQVIVIHREVPAHTRIFEFDEAGHAFGVIMEDFHLAGRSEEPHQQVEEVDADVGGNPAGFAQVALPGGVIPAATRGDIGQHHIVHAVFGCVLEIRFQLDQSGVNA